MKLVLVLVLVASCGDADRGPPDPQQYKAMTDEQKCDATAPRATRCIDELLAAQMKDVLAADAKSGAEIDQALDRTPGATASQASEMHRVSCAGDPHYADAIVACWSTAGCRQFADCVLAHERTAK